MTFTMRQECTDAYQGQQNMTLTAYQDGVKAGHVDWVRFDNVPSIAWMHTEFEFRRQGVATAMLQHLQNEFLRTPIEWGYVATEEGAALIDKITFTIPNAVHREAVAALHDVSQRIDVLTTAWVEKNQPSMNAEQWNDLYDRQRDLTEIVNSAVPELRFVRGAGCPAEQIFRASEALRAVENAASSHHPKP